MLQFEHMDHIKFTPPSSEYDPSRKEGFDDLDSIIISSLVASGLLRNREFTLPSSRPKPYIAGNTSAIYRINPKLQFIDTNSVYRPSFYEVESKAGTKLIGMDSYGRVEARPSETVKIATFGLSGCTAAAIVAEYPDGRKSAHVQHFSPLGRGLSEALFQKEMIESQDAVSRKVVVMTPGQYTQDSEGKWVMTPKDQALVDRLLKDGNLSDGDDVKTYSYDIVKHIESSYGQGTLMVDLGEESVIYTEMCPVKFE
jgi:hypothetical protein